MFGHRSSPVVVKKIDNVPPLVVLTLQRTLRPTGIQKNIYGRRWWPGRQWRVADSSLVVGKGIFEYGHFIWSINDKKEPVIQRSWEEHSRKKSSAKVLRWKQTLCLQGDRKTSVTGIENARRRWVWRDRENWVISCFEEFGFHFKYSEEPLGGFKQEHN